MRKYVSILIAVLLLSPSLAIGAANLLPNPNPQFFNNSGDPCDGCKLYFYATGTSTPKDTYTDSGMGTTNANPVVLNSRGEAATGIWLEGTYSVTLKTSDGTTLWGPKAGIKGVADISAVSLSRWVSSGVTPAYFSTTQFTVSTDYSATFHVGRRLKITETAGTVYGTVTAVSYSAPNTTVTVSLDSGTLDSGISAVELSFEQATNSSISFDMIGQGTNTNNLQSSGTNTWSGTNVFSGATTLSGTNTVSGDITSSGTNTFSGSQVISGTSTISGNISSSGTNTFSGRQNFTGTLGVGAASFGTSADQVIGIASSTAPSTSPADTVQLYEVDAGGTAGRGSLAIRGENGTIVTIGEHINIDDGASDPTTPGAGCGNTGTAVVAAGSTDTAGFVTVGTGSPTNCAVVFGTAFANAPVCVISPQGAVYGYVSSVSTSTFTATFSGTPTAFHYICIGKNE